MTQFRILRSAPADKVKEVATIFTGLAQPSQNGGSTRRGINQELNSKLMRE
jgi:hypothetical protein